MRLDIIDVTPALATEWLGLNTANRKLRKELVQAYALDMKEGRWWLTGDTIKLNGKQLLDGQHRLAAIVVSNTTTPMAVAFDVVAGAQHALDLGTSRGTRDILELRGIANYAATAAVARLVAGWERGFRWGLASNPRLSRLAIADRVDDRIKGSAARGLRGGLLATAVSPSVLGFCHWLFTGRNQTFGEVFIDNLVDGQDSQSTAFALRERLLREKMSAQAGVQRRSSYKVAVIVAGWNAWRRNPHAIKIQLPRDGAFPEPL